MIAKIWKKLGLIILIVACLFNIVTKLVTRTTFIDELKESATYILQQEKNEIKEK